MPESDKVNALLDSWGPPVTATTNTQPQNSPPAAVSFDPGAQQPVQASGTVPRIPFAIRNQIDPNVPVDTETGTGWQVKYNVAQREDPKDKISYLEGIYGKGNARFADNGNPIVRINEGGKAKDLLINENHFTFSDLAGLAAHWKEMLGAGVGITAGRSLPFVGKIGTAAESGMVAKTAGATRDAVAAAVGQEVGGVGNEMANSDNFNSESIQKHLNVARLATDSAINLGFGAGAAALSRVLKPFTGKPGPVETDVADATDYFKRNPKYEESYPRTVGEITGSPIAKRIEAVAGTSPGGSGEMAKVQASKVSTINRIINKMMGLEPGLSVEERAALSPNSEAVGEKAIAELKDAASPVQQAIKASRNQVIADADETIRKEIEQAVGINASKRQFYPGEVGKEIRTSAIAKRDAFKASSSAEYEALKNLPGGEGRVIVPPNIARDAADALENLPGKTVVTEEPVIGSNGQPLVDQFGRAVEPRATVSREILSDFTTADVVSKLKSLQGIQGEPMSLNDLVRMRTAVRNKIAEGESIPGVKTHDYGEVEKILTKAIEEGTATIPDGQLRAAWQAANDNYAKGVGIFKEWPIARLFKEPEHGASFIPDDKIVSNISENAYDSFKRLFGESSPEFTRVKQAIVGDMMNGAAHPGDTLINGKLFFDQLSSLHKNNRKIFDEIFGQDTGSRLYKISDLLNVFEQKGIATPKADVLAKVDSEQLKAALRSGEPLDIAFKRLTKTQENLDALYKSKLLNDSVEGNLDNFNAEEFVNRFYDKASPKEIDLVMSKLTPESQDALRQKTLERIFFEAQGKVGATDRASIGRADFRNPNSKALDAVVGNQDNKEKLLKILGPGIYSDLEMLGKLIRGQEVADQTFKGAGALGAGMRVAKLLHGDVEGYGISWVQEKLASKILNSSGLRNYAEAGAAGGFHTPMADMVLRKGIGNIVAPQVAENWVDAFGPSENLILDDLNKSMNMRDYRSLLKQKTDKQAQAEKDAKINYFLNAPPKSK